MKKALVICVLFSCLLLLTGCAAGPNTLTNTAPAVGGVVGFWMGLWHGMISGFTFIISLFTDNVSIYEVHNNGGWYDFGFVIGAGILFEGSTSTTRKSRRK